jgi:hypothetical protein
LGFIASHYSSDSLAEACQTDSYQVQSKNRAGREKAETIKNFHVVSEQGIQFFGSIPKKLVDIFRRRATLAFAAPRQLLDAS